MFPLSGDGFEESAEKGENNGGAEGENEGGEVARKALLECGFVLHPKTWSIYC